MQKLIIRIPRVLSSGSNVTLAVENSKYRPLGMPLRLDNVQIRSKLQHIVARKNTKSLHIIHSTHGLSSGRKGTEEGRTDSKKRKHLPDQRKVVEKEVRREGMDTKRAENGL
jgi:hypothetical protein